MAQWVAKASGKEPQNGILKIAALSMSGFICTSTTGDFAGFRQKTGDFFNEDDGGVGDGGFEAPWDPNSPSPRPQRGHAYVESTPDDVMAFVNRNWQRLGLRGTINKLQAERILAVLEVIRKAESSGDLGVGGYCERNPHSSATGAWQFILPTWEELLKKGWVSGAAPEGNTRAQRLIQDGGAIGLMGSGQACVLQDLVDGTNPSRVVNGLAKVWAGLPTMGGASHYGYDGLNKANVSLGQITRALA